MKPWIIDADDIRFANRSELLTLERTPAIQSFLRDDSPQFMITGTKGYGKTLLLKAKRVALQENFSCLPLNSLLDKPVGEKIFGRRDIQLLASSSEPWKRIWRAAICMTVLKHFNRTNGLEFHSAVRKLVDASHLSSTVDHFVNILNLSVSDRMRIFADTESLLIPVLRSLNQSVAIFIDSVDEYFGRHLKAGESQASDVGEVSAEVWHFAQMGLLEAAYELRRVTHHLRVYATIRKEAFVRLETSSMWQQYQGSVVDLSYSKDELYEIFCDNIRMEGSGNLIEASRIKEDPLHAFLGVTEIENSFAGRRENAYDYVFRHTFQRPRDLMTIGRRLSNLDTDQRKSETQLKTEINTASKHIANEYLAEIEPYLGGADLKALWSLIPRPVVSRADLDEVAARFPKHMLGSCQNANDLLGRLCRAGVIGITAPDPVTGKLHQRFAAPGSQRVDSTDQIPAASYYLMHPALTEHIAECNGAYLNVSDRAEVIGAERPFDLGDNNETLRECFVLHADIVAFGAVMGTPAESEVRSSLIKSVQLYGAGSLATEVIHGDSFLIIAESADFLVRSVQRIKEDLHTLPTSPILRACIVKGEVRLEGQGDERVPRGGEALRVCARLEPRVASNQVWVDEAVKNALDTEGSYYCARPVTSIDGLTPSEDAKFNIGKDHEPTIMLEVFRVAARD